MGSCQNRMKKNPQHHKTSSTQCQQDISTENSFTLNLHFDNIYVWDYERDIHVSLERKNRQKLAKPSYKKQQKKSIGCQMFTPSDWIGALLIESSLSRQILFTNAFQIGENELLTCAHSCFNRFHGEKYDQITYFPSKNVKIDFDKEQGIKVRQIFFPQEFTRASYEQRNKFQYAFLKLEKPLLRVNSSKNFFTLPNKQDLLPNHSNFQINFCGYPYSTIKVKDGQIDSCMPVSGIGNCQVFKQKDQLLYSIGELIGGAPIYQIKNEKFVVIGIHHGKNTKNGLFQGCMISEEMLENIERWRKIQTIPNASKQNKKPLNSLNLHNQLMNAKSNLQTAIDLKNDKDYLTAIQYFKNSLKIIKKTFEQDSNSNSTSNGMRSTQTLILLGNTHQLIGNNQEQSIDCYQEVRKIYEKNKGKNHPQYANILNKIGGVYLNQQLPEKAYGYFEECSQILSSLLGQNNLFYAAVLNNLAIIDRKRKDYNKALNKFNEVKKILKNQENQQIEQKSERFLTLSSNIANTLCNMNQHHQALVIYEQIDKIMDHEHSRYDIVLNNWGSALCSIGRLKEGQEKYGQCLEMRRNQFGENHKKYQKILKNLSMASKNMMKNK